MPRPIDLRLKFRLYNVASKETLCCSQQSGPYTPCGPRVGCTSDVGVDEFTVAVKPSENVLTAKSTFALRPSSHADRVFSENDKKTFVTMNGYIPQEKVLLTFTASTIPPSGDDSSPIQTETKIRLASNGSKKYLAFGKLDATFESSPYVSRKLEGNDRETMFLTNNPTDPRAEWMIYQDGPVPCVDSITCSGHGKCGADGKCTCGSGWDGPNCDKPKSSPLVAILAVGLVIMVILAVVVIVSKRK